MRKYSFYTTEGCHLCEQAWALVLSAELASHMHQVEIINSEADVSSYGTRIPVIKNNLTENEMGWPFDADDLTNFTK